MGDTMIMGSRRRGRDASGEGGSALIIVLMMIAMLGVLTLTLATLSVNNLVGARRAAQAGVALNAADAGLAQAVAYVRLKGVGDLACSPTCPTNPWGNSSSPTTVTVPGTGGASYKVWVEPVAPYPASNPGLYRIHATGITGSSAGRAVTADLMVAPEKFPLGIFGKSISGGGNGGVHFESMFTTGCVTQREKILFSGVDLLNNIPAAMHSSNIITKSTNNCDPNQSIHNGGPCNTDFPADQDSRGGLLVATDGCFGKPVGLPATVVYPTTSLIATDAELFAKYNLTSPPLTAAQLEQLKVVAKSQVDPVTGKSNYWTNSSGWTSPNPATYPNAVMYFDLLATNPGGEVDLNFVTGFGRLPGLAANDAACGAKSLVIIVDGGNVKLNGNQQLAASVFALGASPYGKVEKANGTASFIGTLYANKITLTGTADMHMDECFKSNMSPTLFDVQTSNYREEDR